MNLFEKLTIAGLAVVAAGSVAGMTINGVNNQKQAEAIEELRAKDAYLQKQINQLKEQYAALKKQEKEDIDRVTADYQTKINSLTTELNKTKTELANLKSQEANDKAELQNKINSLTAKIATLTTQITSLQTQMNNKIKELEDKYNAEIAKLLAKIATLEGTEVEDIDSPKDKSTFTAKYSYSLEKGEWIESTTTKDFSVYTNWTYLRIDPTGAVKHGSYCPHIQYIKFSYYSKYAAENTKIKLTRATSTENITRLYTTSDAQFNVIENSQYNLVKYTDYTSYEYYYENNAVVTLDSALQTMKYVTDCLTLNLVTTQDDVYGQHRLNRDYGIEIGYSLIDESVIL